MTFATLDALRESLAQPGHQTRSPGYVAKMLHDVPESTVVDRARFILERCKGKYVLEFGASGPMHDGITKVAALVKGVDREDAPGVVGFDLDDVKQATLPTIDHVEVIVCGEVIEHLANPGYFLERLKREWPNVPVIVTVPNAFSIVAARHLIEGHRENVNIDHCAWYSYRTLHTLLERHGYVIEAFHWYGGEPYTAEGLIMVVR